MLNQVVQLEIERLSDLYGYKIHHLEEFAEFVINNKSNKRKPINKITKELKLSEIKQKIYDYFEVKSTTELKKSGEFKLATRDMKLNLGQKESGQTLYREFVGILPEEECEQGKDCINGINIFKYFRPWQVFGLDGQTATEEEIKSVYRKLSKTYHPDNQETGDARIFDRINLMYRSISTKIFA
ncbi:MAG: DnaJ domain-containing protein [Synechocystis sp.]